MTSNSGAAMGVMEFSLTGQEEEDAERDGEDEHAASDAGGTSSRLTFMFEENSLIDIYSTNRLRLRRSSSASSAPGGPIPFRPSKGNAGSNAGSKRGSRVGNSAAAEGWATALASEEIRKLQELTRTQANDLRARENDLMLAHQANSTLRARLAELTCPAESARTGSAITGMDTPALGTAQHQGQAAQHAKAEKRHDASQPEEEPAAPSPTGKIVDNCDKAVECNLMPTFGCTMQTGAPGNVQPSDDRVSPALDTPIREPTADYCDKAVDCNLIPAFDCPMQAGAQGTSQPSDDHDTPTLDMPLRGRIVDSCDKAVECSLLDTPLQGQNVDNCDKAVERSLPDTPLQGQYVDNCDKAVECSLLDSHLQNLVVDKCDKSVECGLLDTPLQEQTVDKCDKAVECSFFDTPLQGQPAESCDKAVECNLVPAIDCTTQAGAPGTVEMSQNPSQLDDHTTPGLDTLRRRRTQRESNSNSREAVLRERFYAERFKFCQERRRRQAAEQQQQELQHKIEEYEANMLQLVREVEALRGERQEVAVEPGVRESLWGGVHSALGGMFGSWSLNETVPEQRTTAFHDIMRTLGMAPAELRAQQERVVSDAQRRLQWTAEYASSNLRLSDQNRTITFVGASDHKSRGFAATATPVSNINADVDDDGCISEEFQHKMVCFEVVVSAVQDGHPDGLAIGFTSTPPEDWPDILPDTADAIDGMWLAGFDGEVYSSSAVEPWSHCSWQPANLKCGDQLRAEIHDGEFAVFVNCAEVLREPVELPMACDLYGVVDLLGNTDAVTLVA